MTVTTTAMEFLRCQLQAWKPFGPEALRTHP